MDRIQCTIPCRNGTAGSRTKSSLHHPPSLDSVPPAVHVEDPSTAGLLLVPARTLRWIDMTPLTTATTKAQTYSSKQQFLVLTRTTPSECPVTMTFWVSHSFISDTKQHIICWLRPVKVFTLAVGLPLMLHTWM